MRAGHGLSIVRRADDSYRRAILPAMYARMLAGQKFGALKVEGGLFNQAGAV